MSSSLLKRSVLDTVGRTPLIRVASAAMGIPDDVNIFVKAEAFNPMSSVKDRLALAVVEYAEATGQLVPGQTVVEVSFPTCDDVPRF